MNLSIVIPCFNEAENIPLLLERFAQSTSRSDIELIVVDNGSSDNTGDVAESLMSEYAFSRVLRLENNRGYGGGIKAGLAIAKGSYIGWTHADLQTDPFDAVRALEIIEKDTAPEKAFVKGKRGGRPMLDSLFTAGMSAYETLYMGEVMYDINAQPNIFHRSFLNLWKNAPDDFSLDLYAYYMAKKGDMNIIRFPVTFSKREYGKSKWNTGMRSRLKFIRRTIDYSKKLKREM